jgi:glycosyltransferase involved in cell wall biosynthesis
MRFSIVTPSFNQFVWLKRCARSVADQGVELEHIIQDAGTGFDLETWVRERTRAKLFVERDRGMYDAINRGLARATGDVCAFLNCDEQYLPGTLARVERAFSANPHADLIVGDFLVLDPECRVLSFRKVTPLRSAMIRTDHLYAFTCAIFFRRRILEAGITFDANLKDVADGEWICRVLDHGYKAACVREYLSAFTFTGGNRSTQPLAKEEKLRAQRSLPWTLRAAGPLLRQIRHLEKLVRGAYWSGPIGYEIFADSEDRTRTKFRCERPSYLYPTGTVI